LNGDIDMKVLAQRLARHLPTANSTVHIGSHLVVAVVLLWLGPTQTAEAESLTETARTQFAHGVELADRGDYQGALQAFSDAYSTSPNIAVLYNIGQAQISLGRPLEAAETLSRYLREGQDGVPPQRRRQVEEQLRLLESFQVALELSSDAANLAISIDGQAVGRTPLPAPIRLTPGTHTLTAAVPELPQGDATPVPPATPQPHDCPKATDHVADLKHVSGRPVSGDGGLRAALPYTLAGAGIALGAGALGVYLWKRGEYQRWQDGEAALKSEAPSSPRYQTRVADDQRLAASLTTANHTMVGLSITGGVLLAAGATLYLLDRASVRRATNLSVAWAGGSSVAAEWSCSW
jgi:hypothetical protein